MCVCLFVVLGLCTVVVFAVLISFLNFSKHNSDHRHKGDKSIPSL